ncbi:tetratricopeptide repeat protein [soil metagenome]
MRIASIILLLLSLSQLQAQNEATYLRQGNELYQQKKYQEAAAKYAKALNIKSDYLAAYLNQGNVLYQQDSLEGAIKQYELAANLATDKNIKAQAYHNLGNTHLKAGKYQESVEAYKNALRNNPNDPDTRYNLAYAQGMIKNQPPQDQDKDQQNQDKDNDKNDDKNSGKKDDQKKDGQSKDEEGQKNDKPKDPKDGNKGNPKDAEKPNDKQEKEKNMKPPKAGEISKADLEKLLDALKNEEIKVQEKLQRKEQPNEKTTIEKDW